MPKCMRCMQDYEQLEYCPNCGAESGLTQTDTGQIPAETILNRRFILGEILGRDRIGFTYIAWDALLERKVAIREWFPYRLAEREKDGKTVKSSMENSLWEDLCQEFLKQAERLHRLQKLTVLVPVYGFFQENHTAYYVMEYLNGETLGNVLKRENPFPVSKAAEYMERVHGALELLHKEGMIHGNLTPDNLFLCKDGSVKFFNLAWTSRTLEQIRYTVFQTRYASFAYSAFPVKEDVSMDTYSESAVYYRLLTGEEPVSAIRRLKKEKLPSLSEYGIAVPSQTEKQIMEGMKAETETEKGKGLLKFLQRLHVVLLAAAAVMGALIFI